jgi:hypothetical protein
VKPPSLYLARRMKQRKISEEEIDEVLGATLTTYRSASDASRTVILGTTRVGLSSLATPLCLRSRWLQVAR